MSELDLTENTTGREFGAILAPIHPFSPISVSYLNSHFSHSCLLVSIIEANHAFEEVQINADFSHLVMAFNDMWFVKGVVFLDIANAGAHRPLVLALLPSQCDLLLTSYFFSQVLVFTESILPISSDQ